MSVSGGGVLKTAKNAAAAQQFLKFVTGAAGQEVLQKGTSFEYPVGSAVPANEKLVPLTELQAPAVDPAKLNSAKVTELMTKAGVLLARGGGGRWPRSSFRIARRPGEGRRLVVDRPRVVAGGVALVVSGFSLVPLGYVVVATAATGMERLDEPGPPPPGG